MTLSSQGFLHRGKDTVSYAYSRRRERDGVVLRPVGGCRGSFLGDRVKVLQHDLGMDRNGHCHCVQFLLYY